MPAFSPLSPLSLPILISSPLFHPSQARCSLHFSLHTHTAIFPSPSSSPIFDLMQCCPTFASSYTHSIVDAKKGLLFPGMALLCSVHTQQQCHQYRHGQQRRKGEEQVLLFHSLARISALSLLLLLLLFVASLSGLSLSVLPRCRVRSLSLSFLGHSR